MRLIRSIYRLPPDLSKGCALTIGNFDGVHLGHQQILQGLRAKAKALNLPMVVMLFEPQPREYFSGDNAPVRLMRLRDKLHYLAQLGVENVLCVKFDQQVAQQSADEFIADWLVARLNVRFLSVGDDFRFGTKRQGNFALLQQAAQKFAFEVTDHQSFCFADQRISSTAIRTALLNDQLTLAEKMLGRPYRTFGKVVQGNQLGRTIGFPTANIALPRQRNPVQGVYGVKVRLKNGEIYQGVANIGNRPTINGTNQILEVHLFDFQQDLYRQYIEVEFCLKIRNEVKFHSFEALKQQIAQDVLQAKQFFCENP